MTHKQIAVAALTLMSIVSFSHQVFSAEATDGVKKVVIDTPGLCSKVDRVDGDNVYLLSTDKDCVQGIGKASVEIVAGIASVNIYLDGVFWKKQDVSAASGLSPDVVNAVNIEAEKRREKLTAPPNKHTTWAQEKAGEFSDIVNAPEFQKRVKDETERLKKEVFGKRAEEYHKNDKTVIGKTDDGRITLSEDERVYVFISSSIPVQTIRNYASAVDKVKDTNIVMVLRGFINGLEDINSTLMFTSRVFVRDPGCENIISPCPTFDANLEIDPLLFRRYEVSEVPAVVYASGVRLLNGGGSEGLASNAGVGRYYKVSGDASLDYLLETINKEARRKSLEGLVEAMRKGFYQ